MVRLTTKLSDGEMSFQHAGAQALVCALGSAARGRALYANRRSLQRLVSRRFATLHEALAEVLPQEALAYVSHAHEARY